MRERLQIVVSAFKAHELWKQPPKERGHLWLLALWDGDRGAGALGFQLVHSKHGKQALTVVTNATCQFSSCHSQRMTGDTTAINMISMASTTLKKVGKHCVLVLVSHQFFPCVPAIVLLILISSLPSSTEGEPIAYPLNAVSWVKKCSRTLGFMDAVFMV